MMFPKTVFAIALLLMVTVTAGPVHHTTGALRSMYLEEPCVLQGGLCMLIADCEPSDLVMSYTDVPLCPEHAYLNISCCYTR